MLKINERKQDKRERERGRKNTELILHVSSERHTLIKKKVLIKLNAIDAEDTV